MLDGINTNGQHISSIWSCVCQLCSLRFVFYTVIISQSRRSTAPTNAELFRRELFQVSPALPFSHSPTLPLSGSPSLSALTVCALAQEPICVSASQKFMNDSPPTGYPHHTHSTHLSIPCNYSQSFHPSPSACFIN